MTRYIELLRDAKANGFSVKTYLKSMNPIIRGFYQEALFNIFYLFWSKSNNRLIPSGGNFSGNTALTIPFDIVKLS